MNWENLHRRPLAEITAWAAARPWGVAMAACGQDAGRHAEGDVWTHTLMVCDQVAALESSFTLSAHDRTVLTFAALFHDAGKPQTTHFDPESGRIRSPNHAVVGERLARTELRALGCPPTLREEIAALVRGHGRPWYVFERPDPVREIVTLSWRSNNRLLYLFALADTRGRRTAETGRSEDNLELFRIHAEEHGCFDRPYPFASDHARFHYFRRPDGDVHYVPHEAFRGEVLLLSGLPGVGKDTWLGRHRPNLPLISLDDLRSELDVEPTGNQGEVIRLASERCREFLRAGRPFAFGATNLLRSTRKRWIDLFDDYGARIEIAYLEPPFEVLLARNRRRERVVPEEVIRRLADRLEPPTPLEAHACTWYFD